MKFPGSQDPSQIALLEHSVEGASEYNLLVELIINTGAYSYETLYQSDLVGWAGLFVSIVGTSLLCSKHPRIALILFFCCMTRPGFLK